MLATEGFTEVYSMEGGIRAWDGLTAAGLPDAGMAYFPEQATGEELAGLAWLLEEGSRRFYSELSRLLDDREAAGLFEKLVTAEEQHKSALAGLAASFTGRAGDADPFQSMQKPEKAGDVMEGGMRVSEALAWTKGRSTAEVLELAMALETNSYDLYIKMERRTADERSRQVFSMLSSGEKDHLDRLAALLDIKA